MGMVVYEEVGPSAAAGVEDKWRRRGRVNGGEERSRGRGNLIVGEFDRS
jgi:hypothetical protein